MNILLVGINAKYIHSNLAIRYLQRYLENSTAYHAEIAEYTINHRIDTIMREIYEQAPELIGFSCYIWNFEYVKELTVELKKLLPNAVFVWGGPEVSYQSEQYIGNDADYIICGEGEQTFAELVHRLESGQVPEKRVLYGEPVEMDTIPFVYDDLADLKNRIIYYESSRGCPFQCQYCLSSIEKRVHFHSMERTLSDLDFFLAHQVMQVKLVDRTFNCDKKRTKELWRYLLAHDNGVTNFHFEIAGELIDEECLTLLSQARKGFFQLEIGVQSVNPLTLREIRRETDMEQLFAVVRRIKEMGNIHIHLDLIAGLPYEDIESFAHSFNTVYALGPHQLQLGFLKVLKGSGICQKQAEYGIVHTDKPPYEVLYTNWLSYDDVLRLKLVEDMVERYYNSNRYKLSCNYLCSLFDSPFAFFDALGHYYKENKFHLEAVSEIDSYTVLYEFLNTLGRGDLEKFKWLAKYDLYSHKKAKKWPEWMNNDLVLQYKQQIRHFYGREENRICFFPQYPETDPRQLSNLLHLEIFPFDPVSGESQRTACLFCYRNCDILGNAETVIIPIDILTDY